MKMLAWSSIQIWLSQLIISIMEETFLPLRTDCSIIIPKVILHWNKHSQEIWSWLLLQYKISFATYLQCTSQFFATGLSQRFILQQVTKIGKKFACTSSDLESPATKFKSIACCKYKQHDEIMDGWDSLPLQWQSQNLKFVAWYPDTTLVTLPLNVAT